MPFEIHPEAAKNFNEKGANLAEQATTLHLVLGGRRSFQPDHYISGRFTDADLLPDSFTWTESRNIYGEVFGVSVSRNGKPISLEATAHKGLDELASRMGKTKGLRDLITARVLRQIIMHWIWLRRHSVLDQELMAYIGQEVEGMVRDVTVWLPVFGLSVQEDFTLAGVKVVTMTSELVDPICTMIVDNAPPGKDAEATTDALRIRKMLQGRAALVVDVRAEGERALELALARTTGPLTILRFFSAAAQVPQARSFLTLLGGEHLEHSVHLTAKDGTFTSFSEGMSGEDADQMETTYDRERVRMLLQAAKHLDQLYSVQNPNEFQETCRGVLEMFTRATLYRSVSEKLIHMLVALESLLLRDQSEPIQENLGYRIAFSKRATVDERRAVIAAVKEAYRLRSKFLHHGIAVSPDPEDMESVTLFMKVARTFLAMLPEFAAVHSTRAAFLDMLETRRLGGAA